MEKGLYENSQNNVRLSQQISITLSDNKRPIKAQQHRKFISKMEHLSLQLPSEAFIFNQKPLSNNVSFSIPKEKITGNKRIIIVPKKVFCKERGYAEDKNDFFQNGQMRALNQYLIRQKQINSATLKQALREEKPTCAAIQTIKNKGRLQIYQSLKKKPLASQKDKLKPILVSQQVSNKESTFFSIQKLTLSQGDMDKRFKSSIVNLAGENIPNPNFIIKQTNNSKIVKNFNSAKGRWNLQRIASLNQQLKFGQDNSLRNIITISHLTPCSQGEKSPLNFKRQTNSAKVLDQGGQIDYIFNLNINKYRERQLSKTSNQALIDVVNSDIQVINKAKISLVKRPRRKFNVPFQTYYYRDLLWKANYANSLYVEVPIEYEHRLKVYVGKGNNSCMVSGLIARRSWYALTDRVEQANFVWSQIKMLNYFKMQESLKQQTNVQPLQVPKYKQQSILTQSDDKQYKNYFNTFFNTEQHNDERLQSRAKNFKYKKIVKVNEIKETKMHNHLINNYVIGNKKALFNTMSNYYNELNLDVFDFLPLTFHIKDGLQDKNYFQFLRYYHKRAKEIKKNNQDKNKAKEYNAWIVKPGQNSNRGNGITMCLTLEDIKKVLKQREKYADGTYRTHIVQAYIQRPLLYHRRKFDIRHYMMITSINGYLKGYWYKDGYVRTTSSEYSLLNSNGGIHLTNDAIQKNLPDYGKYQKGNKISYDQLASYIQKFHGKKGKKFYQHIYPKMQRIATDAVRACSGGIDPAKLSNNFQIFGLDFMIDVDLDVWLIEINTNPCLELSCPLLSSIIPKFIENTLQLTLDCMFPPPVRYTPKGVHYFKQLQKENRFSLIYDERHQKLYHGSLQVLDNKLLEQQDDVFEDCGDQWQDN